jgi:hypothetical protein
MQQLQFNGLQPLRIGSLLVGSVQKIGPFEVDIHSIDDATREFYEQLGVAQEQTSDALMKGPSLPFPLSIQEQHANQSPQTVSYPELPFGLGEAEGDEAGSCRPKLMPQPPRRDVKRLLDLNGLQLRYSARFTNDPERQVVITFFPADDGISVMEVGAGMNNGAKFLSKARVRKGNGREYYHYEEFVPGAQVTFHSHKLTITGMDEFTRKWLSDADFRTSQLYALEAASRHALQMLTTRCRFFFHARVGTWPARWWGSSRRGSRSSRAAAWWRM